MIVPVFDIISPLHFFQLFVWVLEHPVDQKKCLGLREVEPCGNSVVQTYDGTINVLL
jgi:hypothetical protein